MKKRITFEEAANLKNTIQAPPRLPYHADVNGNPVYQQFMRLTHIYEEDELVKRQDEMQALAARLAMLQGLSTGRPPVPRFEMSGQGPGPTPMFSPIGSPGGSPGGPPGGPPAAPPLGGPSAPPSRGRVLQLPGGLGMAAGPTGPESEFDELRASEESAAMDLELRSAAAQDDEERKVVQMARTGVRVVGDVARGVASAGYSVGGIAGRVFAEGVREIMNTTRNWTFGEWGGRVLIAMGAALQLQATDTGFELSEFLGGQLAIAGASIGASMTVAQILLTLSGWVTSIAHDQRLHAARAVVEMSLDMLRQKAIKDHAQSTDQAAREQIEYALEQVDHRQRWLTLYSRGDQQAVHFLEVVHRASKTAQSQFTPLDYYPDPDEGLWIEEITNDFVREQTRLALPGPQAGPLALPAPQAGPLALPGYSPSSPTQPTSLQLYEPPESSVAMDVDDPPRPPPAAAPAADENPIARGRIKLKPEEVHRLIETMESRGEATGVDSESGMVASFKFDNGNILRFSHGGQIFLRLEYPGRKLGAKIMTLEATQQGPDDMEIRVDIFERAKKLGPKTDWELAAVRDHVLAARQLGAGTPNQPVPMTPVFRRYPATPVPATPQAWPRPLRSPGAAAGSGASGSGASGSAPLASGLWG